MVAILLRNSVFTASLMLGTILSSAAFAQTSPGAPATPQAASPPVDCSKTPDPYVHYECLDTYLGTGVFERLANYYVLEWGKAGPPSDPNAPPGRIADWPGTPETTPPMPFTEWPYGGTNPLGVTRPNSIDSPLMVAIANTGLGKWMSDAHLQLYGWVDPGINVSSNSQHPGGNAPIAYAYTPNVPSLDQVVLYLDRFADTVQTDHIDWGLRLSAIYGENYRYTTSYGLASYQLLKHNDVNGYDFPMVYFDLYIPFIAQGMNIRVGRYISVPDIEAQLAPNNYMYTHSLTYATDNYTNEGIYTTTAITKQLFFAAGIVFGTEAPVWHLGETVANPNPNPLFPGRTFKRDPGSQPSATACIRYTTPDGATAIQPCMDGINSGRWGYNNLQWFGFTFYHKFNEHWHNSFEFYNEHQNKVPNVNNPTLFPTSQGPETIAQIYGNGGTPFSPPYITANAPNLAHCKSTTVLDCRATGMGVVDYLNYSPQPLDNYSLRGEYYADDQGQRFGTPTDYYEVTFGWQHWFSPQIEIRPEIGYYRSVDADAFNANFSRSGRAAAPDKNHTLFAASDLIFHW